MRSKQLNTGCQDSAACIGSSLTKQTTTVPTTFPSLSANADAASPAASPTASARSPAVSETGSAVSSVASVLWSRRTGAKPRVRVKAGIEDAVPEHPALDKSLNKGGWSVRANLKVNGLGLFNCAEREYLLYLFALFVIYSQRRGQYDCGVLAPCAGCSRQASMRAGISQISQLHQQVQMQGGIWLQK